MELHRRPVTPETALLVDAATGEPRAVASSFPRDTWTPRQAAAPGQLRHPGTALKIGERWYEIVGARPAAARPHITLYQLAPWDDSLVIRTTDEITPQACRAAAQRYREAQTRRARGWKLGLLPFLTGLLPAEDQLRFEREYGVPAPRATFLSAVPLVAVSVFVLMAGFAAARGLDLGDASELLAKLWRWKLVFVYLLAESLTRIVMGLSSDQPLGSLIVAAPILVARAVRDAWLGALRAPPKTSEHAFSTVRDTVRPWPGPEADLEVLSRLPKDHWTANVTIVVYEGTPYLLVDRQQLHEGVERYRFLLKVPENEVLYQHVCEYEPEEVREIYRARRRHKGETWVRTFGFAWGWLDPGRQERLAAIYDHDPKRMTQLSIVFNGVVGGVAAAQGIVRLRTFGGLLDLLELVAGIWLVWESVVRWNHWSAGRWRPSVLGFFSRPFADRLLRWE